MKHFIAKYFYWALCFASFIALSYVARFPILGKLKFLTLNTFYPILEYQVFFPEKLDSSMFIVSDVATEYTLNAAFGTKGQYSDRVVETGLHYTRNVNDLLNDFQKSNNKTCVINFKGFPETWVPSLTLHWDPNISKTSLFYRSEIVIGEKLEFIYKRNRELSHCRILKKEQTLWEDSEIVRYFLPNLNYENQQEDLHIIQFKDSNINQPYTVMIDSGFYTQTIDRGLDFLAKNGIYKIDELYITHAHKDHYSGIYAFLEYGIPIGRIFMNFPIKENCDKEKPWGCDFEDLKILQKKLNDRGIPIFSLVKKIDDPIHYLVERENAKLELIFASPPEGPFLGNTDINDMSMIMKLKAGNKSLLFTGDLNLSLSNFLIGSNSLESDILKVPHHGTEGIASNEFFDSVNARIAIVPSPKHLWCSDRSKRPREYFESKSERIFVSGFSGDILIRFFSDKDIEKNSSEEKLKYCI